MQFFYLLNNNLLILLINLSLRTCDFGLLFFILLYFYVLFLISYMLKCSHYFFLSLIPIGFCSICQSILVIFFSVYYFLNFVQLLLRQPILYRVIQNWLHSSEGGIYMGREEWGSFIIKSVTKTGDICKKNNFLGNLPYKHKENICHFLIITNFSNHEKIQKVGFNYLLYCPIWWNELRKFKIDGDFSNSLFKIKLILP